MKIINTVFFVFLGIFFTFVVLGYLLIFVLPWLACHNETLRQIFTIDSLYCYGEAYDVKTSLVTAFGLMLGGGLLIAFCLFMVIKKSL